ncbi:S-adenosyl-L-methionine-dependent methyltransferase [Leptodontidium sp. MPI-SDFR-AT-0119]|nr:S-adenosyl-L-methionine-dependent methyltransferase [Leptodontidium sp. MPI-SDFR-AT-0119]
MPSPKPDSPNSPSNLEAPTNVLTTDNPIVADEAGFGDDDGGYNSDQASTSSTSISSSIRNHTFEDGIRYHRFHDGQYAFPNDENEQNRDDMKHAMTLLLCNQKLHFAPLGDSPQRIIDLGTGTGIWAIEMADTYPSAEVIGIDLSPIQPPWVPPNLRFLVDDLEDEWVYPENHFDYVHVRHTLHSIRKPAELMERAMKHTKPGGWVEFQELHYYPHCDDESLDRPYAVREWLEYVRDGVANFGSDLNGVTKLREKMEAAGFINIEEQVLRCPVGIWPKNRTLKLAGLYWRTAISDGLMSVAKRPMEKGLGWSVAEIEVFLVGVRKALHDSSFHAYMPLHMLYGQKPSDKAVRTDTDEGTTEA